jgi:hypothetical protein
MKRAWIILSTELKAWRRDPLTVMGGIIPPLLLLLAFALLFNERPTIKIALIDHDEGGYGQVLRTAIETSLSPFGEPYYDILPLSEEEAWEALRTYRIDGVWVVPIEFSQRVMAGAEPRFQMHFTNYIDDLAKNHRIYYTEVMWTFYRAIGLPPPPLEMREEYPLPRMVKWLPIIGVGLALMSFILGGMMNILMLTYKEQVSGITLEFGLSPRSLTLVLLPKLLLALLMSLVTGTIFLGILSLWTHSMPWRWLPAVFLLGGLTTLFWISAVLLIGLRTPHFMGAAIAVVLTAMVMFFVGGGLAVVRSNAANVPWFSWLFPNAYAVDPLRDLILFDSWPRDWGVALLKLCGFALGATGLGMAVAARWLRRAG